MMIVVKFHKDLLNASTKLTHRYGMKKSGFRFKMYGVVNNTNIIVVVDARIYNFVSVYLFYFKPRLIFVRQEENNN